MAARSTTTLTCFLHGPTSRISTCWGSLVATASGAVTESDLVTVPVGESEDMRKAPCRGPRAAGGRTNHSDWKCRENVRGREVRGGRLCRPPAAASVPAPQIEPQGGQVL